MNLAILIGHFPPGPFGGAELQAEAWALRLADRHHVTVVTRDLPQTFAPPGGRVLTVGRLIPDKGMDVVVDAVAGIQTSGEYSQDRRTAAKAVGVLFRSTSSSLRLGVPKMGPI